MQNELEDLLQRIRANGIVCGADAERLSKDARLKNHLYRALLPQAQPEDRALICYLLDCEIGEHNQNEWLADNMVICAYLLARQRRVEDSQRLWEAKMANFSTWLGLNVVSLVAGGIDETLAFWEKYPKSVSRESAANFIGLVKQARADGRLNVVEEQLVQVRNTARKVSTVDLPEWCPVRVVALLIAMHGARASCTRS